MQMDRSEQTEARASNAHQAEAARRPSTVKEPDVPAPPKIGK